MDGTRWGQEAIHGADRRDECGSESGQTEMSTFLFCPKYRLWDYLGDKPPSKKAFPPFLVSLVCHNDITTLSPKKFDIQCLCEHLSL